MTVAQVLAALFSFVVTQSLVASAVTAGFVIGAGALFLVHRDVSEMGVRLDRQNDRIEAIEGLVHRLEERWSADK